MTNKEITKVVFNNAEISALYYGDVLIWKKEEGSKTFKGSFVSYSNENNWWYIDSNGNRITLPVDAETKKFETEIDTLTSCKDMFYLNQALSTIDEFPDTSNVIDMSRMFSDCYMLSSINLSNFNTSKVTDMSKMFNGCNSLNTLDLSSFDTSKVTTMENMCLGVNYITKLDSINFNTTNCTNLNGIFSGCSKLANITGVFEGTKVDIDLHYCPLTNASTMVFINGLTNVSSTKTLSLKSSTYNTLTPEQIAVATSKGWTVISV